ncbi:hypothetical protein ACA910_010903 [Epithemia clementina (nom. ined.)]
MDWLGFGSTSTTTTAATQTSSRAAAASAAAAPDPLSFAQRPLERGEIGVSLPPGASKNNTALAMAPAYTGQDDDEDILRGGSGGGDTIQFSSSREDEDAALMGSSGGGAARVAKQQPLFPVWPIPSRRRPVPCTIPWQPMEKGMYMVSIRLVCWPCHKRDEVIRQVVVIKIWRQMAVIGGPFKTLLWRTRNSF